MKAMLDLAKALRGKTSEMHRDIDQLIGELGETIVSLEDVRARLAPLARSEGTFARDFPKIHEYYRNVYASRLKLSKSRTHCSEVRMKVNRIDFKFATLMTTDVGRAEWQRVKDAIRLITEDDERIKQFYLDAMYEVQDALAAIDKTLATDQAKAWKKLQSLLRAFTKRLDGMNAALDRMGDAQLVLRQHVG